MVASTEIASEVLGEIERTLDVNGFDYVAWIESMQQVFGFERRLRGESFSLQDHVRGLILAQLSNQRPWGPIAENLDKLSEILLEFEPEALKSADPVKLTTRIRSLRCGNRQIAKQMQMLRRNINVLEGIEDIDHYVVSRPPMEIAKSFAEGPYKLQQVGVTLAMEYLRNVGVDTIKPDLHICRIIGPERLRLVEKEPTPEEATDALLSWAKATGHSAMYVDNLLWLFGAQDYAAICDANPKCEICSVSCCQMKL